MTVWRAQPEETALCAMLKVWGDTAMNREKDFLLIPPIWDPLDSCMPHSISAENFKEKSPFTKTRARQINVRKNVPKQSSKIMHLAKFLWIDQQSTEHQIYARHPWDAKINTAHPAHVT